MRNVSVQNEGFSLAGFLVDVSAENLAKPNIQERNTLSYMRDFPVCTALNFVTSTLTRKGGFSESLKKGLPTISNPVYGYSTPAKSGAGIGVLVKSKATHDAPGVFFCVVSPVHPFFSGAVSYRACIRIMVGWAGASSEAPVPFDAGYANPVQPITNEIGVSGDGFNPQSKEAAIMATTPTQNPQFIWLIAAVRRDCPTISAVIHHIPADSEQNARRTLVREHVCFFAGRLPVQEVRNA